MIIRITLLIFLTTFVAACSKHDDDLGVIVVANGHELTDVYLDRCCETALAFLKHRTPAMSPDQIAKFQSMFKSRYPKQFVRDAVIADYAEREGIAVPEKALKAGRKAAFVAYRKMGDKTFDGLLASTGASRDVVEKQIRQEVLVDLVKDHLVELSPTNFPSDYAALETAKMRQYNASMALTNALVFIHATNVWHMLQHGSNFVVTADAYTEIETDRGGNCEWGAFSAKDLQRDYPEVLRVVSNLSEGAFTPPIESDNGLVILHYDGRDAEDRILLSRIFFRLPLFLEIASPAEILETARSDYREELFKRKVKQLLSEANVQYFVKKTKRKERQ